MAIFSQTRIAHYNRIVGNLSTFICPHKYTLLLVSLARLVTGCLPFSPSLLLMKSALASNKTPVRHMLLKIRTLCNQPSQLVAFRTPVRKPIRLQASSSVFHFSTNQHTQYVETKLGTRKYENKPGDSLERDYE